MLDRTSQSVIADIKRIRSVGGERPLAASILRPQARRGRPLIALHGIGREYGALVDAFLPEAARADRIVVVPEFDKDRWPVFQRVGGKTRPDCALLALLEDLRQRGLVGDGPVDLFGYSGGAQLAHRFAMLHPEQIGDLHLGAAGWYTLPQTDIPYPLGVGAAKKDSCFARRMSNALPAFLNRKITLYVGDLDNRPNDPALRRRPELDRLQGETRMARAQSYAQRIAEAQRAHDLPVRVCVQTLRACGHNFADCAQRAGLARMVSG